MAVVPEHDIIFFIHFFHVHFIFTGKTPIGELFNPGYDCSKILDSNPEAKDGMYFIHLGTKYPKQVNYERLRGFIIEMCKIMNIATLLSFIAATLVELQKCCGYADTTREDLPYVKSLRKISADQC